MYIYDMETTMYDLVHIIDGRVREVIEENKPITICKWRGNLLKKTTHTIGLLQSRKVSNRPKGGWLCHLVDNETVGRYKNHWDNFDQVRYQKYLKERAQIQ